MVKADGEDLRQRLSDHTDLSPAPQHTKHMMVELPPVTYMILIPDVLERAQAPRHSVHRLEVGQINKSRLG